jgi:hypothetical protein
MVIARSAFSITRNNSGLVHAITPKLAITPSKQNIFWVSPPSSSLTRPSRVFILGLSAIFAVSPRAFSDQTGSENALEVFAWSHFLTIKWIPLDRKML